MVPGKPLDLMQVFPVPALGANVQSASAAKLAQKEAPRLLSHVRSMLK